MWLTKAHTSQEASTSISGSSSPYLELAEKFRNEPQKVIKFLRDEQKKDIDNDTKYIIEILTSLILIIIEDYYLEDDSFNELLIEFIYDKKCD